jgi:hypothetical protein
MTQPAVNSEQVAALFAERRQYEAWLATLEAKRATTPPHIYHRVHTDYAARLQRVNEQLASHHAALRELESTLTARLTSLDIDEARCRDEAAEVELRALVGELSPEHQREVVERTQAALSAVTDERARVVDELSRLRMILEAAAPPATPTPAEAPAAPQSAASQPPSEPAAQPQASAAPAAGGAESGAQSAAGMTPVGPAADDWQRAFEGIPQPRTTPSSSPSTVAVASHGAGSAPERVAGPGPFDDLEFLKAMTESRPAAAGSDPASATPEAAAPTSAAPANAPVQTPRATEAIPPSEPPAEQPKTLKCQECNTLNYPTEWYCERCGAELAAL